MTFEELTEKYEELQRDFLKTKESLEAESKAKEEATIALEEYKEKTTTELEEIRKRNESLMEHNNNLFRQVTYPVTNNGPNIEDKTPDELLSDVLDKF